LGEFRYSYHIAQEEAEICVADAATTTRAGQPAETVKEELEQVFETAQAEEEEKNEHSEEWLNTFSQEAEKTATWSLQKKKRRRRFQTTLVWRSV
jgi:hypothetical protein